MEKFRDANPPGLVYGDEAPVLEPHPLGKMSGVATSMGRYTGPARVARGIQDFNKVEHGDVLVIPYSDVGMVTTLCPGGGGNRRIRRAALAQFDHRARVRHSGSGVGEWGDEFVRLHPGYGRWLYRRNYHSRR